LVQEREETLKLLGLSHTQAHVYLTLIKTGKSCAKTLANQTGVACPDIYRIMDIFEKMGLIQKTIELPKKYEAIKIEQALPILIKHKIEETKKLDEEVRIFIKEMKQEQKQNKKNETGSDLILVPATQVAVLKRKESIRNTKDSIDSIISWKGHKEILYQNLKTETKKAIEKGVKHRLIIENPQKINLQLESEVLSLLIKKGGKIKYLTKCPPALVTIYDKKEALICTSNKAGLCDTPIIWTNNDSIVSIVSSYFEYLWTTTETQ
jgi:sugar-specific transcriptional regulator TrmB